MFCWTENHISHLTDITDVQLNELLGAIVDIENLFISMHREVDEETRKVYNYLFHVSRKSFYSFRWSANSFLLPISAFTSMHFIPSTSCYTRPTRWSALRSSIHFEGGFEFSVSKVQSLRAGRIHSDDRDSKNIFELLEFLEFRKPQRSMQGIVEWGCVNV